MVVSVNIRGLSGDILATVTAGRTWTVSGVKLELEECLGIPRQEQRFFAATRRTELRDVERLSSLGDYNPLEITLIRRNPEQAHWLHLVEVAGVGAGNVLRDAPEAIRADREVVLAAARQSGDALQYAESSLQCDPEIVLTAVEHDGCALRHAAPDVRCDRRVAMAAVSQNGAALRHVAADLQGDKAIALMAAFKSPKQALSHTTEELRRSQDFMLDVMRQRGQRGYDALKYASPSLLEDRDMALAAVQLQGAALKHFSQAVRADKEVVLAAVRTDGRAITYAAKELLSNRVFILSAAAANGRVLKHLPEHVKLDRQVVITAVRNDGKALQYAGLSLRSDAEIILVATETDFNAVKFGLAMEAGAGARRISLSLMEAGLSSARPSDSSEGVMIGRLPCAGGARPSNSVGFVGGVRVGRGSCTNSTLGAAATLSLGVTTPRCTGSSSVTPALPLPAAWSIVTPRTRTK